VRQLRLYYATKDSYKVRAGFIVLDQLPMEQSVVLTWTMLLKRLSDGRKLLFDCMSCSGLLYSGSGRAAPYNTRSVIVSVY